MNIPLLPVLFAFLCASLVLAGCEKNDRGNQLTQQTVKKYDKATILEGTVSNDDGPIKTGVIKVTDSKQQIVASTTIQNTGQYRVEIPANTALPIVLTFYPDAENKSEKQMFTAVVHASITKYDINPLSTAIAKTAKSMGGYTHANMVRAAEDSGSVPDSNKTTQGFRGDPTKQYGGWH